MWEDGPTVCRGTSADRKGAVDPPTHHGTRPCTLRLNAHSLTQAHDDNHADAGTHAQLTNRSATGHISC